MAMMETLALALGGLSLVVLLYTVLGTHSSPLPPVRNAKFGCLTAIGLFLAALSVASTPSLSSWNQCDDACYAAVGEGQVPAKFATYGEAAKAEFRKCVAKSTSDNEKKKVAQATGEMFNGVAHGQHHQCK